MDEMQGAEREGAGATDMHVRTLLRKQQEAVHYSIRLFSYYFLRPTSTPLLFSRLKLQDSLLDSFATANHKDDEGEQIDKVVVTEYHTPSA